MIPKNKFLNRFLKTRILLFIAIFSIFLVPFVTHAASKPPRIALAEVYAMRSDLQKIYSSSSWIKKSTASRATPATLETWARIAGWREYPETLLSYKPETTQIISKKTGPQLRKGVVFPETLVSAESFIVIDRETGFTLLAHKPTLAWPLASLTKLMTALVAVEHTTSFDEPIIIATDDQVGGGTLHVPTGTTLPFSDHLAATLIGSSNNNAHTLSHSGGYTTNDFITAMNTYAHALGAITTTYVDPTGLDAQNMSTVTDLALIANAAFENQTIRGFVNRSFWDLIVPGEQKNRHIKTTDHLLTDPQYADINVVAGKTGYIDESKWNLATITRPAGKKSPELLIVTFGSKNKTASFSDTAALARWTWKNFSWKK